MTTGLDGTPTGTDPGAGGAGLPRDVALRLYESMVLIRRVEERLRDDSAAGKLPGAVHLYIGEEAVAAGVCAHLGDRDYATSTHRGHGHFLAKGGDVRAMMAEIWAKREGICRGMGGSMHVADISKGILGANGIVGAGLSIATGAAFGAKLDGNDVTDVWRAAGAAVRRARDGGGPSFIEARTYRIQGHFEAEAFVLAGGRYRDDAEIDEWRTRDPLGRLGS